MAENKMAYKYPKISNCLIYKRNSADEIEITDYVTEEIYNLGVDEAKYIKKLDGKTHPYEIDTSLTTDEIDWLIEELDECGLLKESSWLYIPGGTVMKTIWEPKWTVLLRIIAFFLE